MKRREGDPTETVPNIQSRSVTRQNNFNLIRLVGAFLVMIGHMGPIMGIQTPVMGKDLHGIGVEILFLIGGYLITESWMHDPNPLRYSIRRFLRLWPPFAVMTLIMTFLAGPLLSNLGVDGYYGSWWSEYLKNLRFYIIYAQPGVFTDAPIPYVTNGSLWTMPVELVLYIITPIFIELFRIRKIKNSGLLSVLGILILISIGAWLESQDDLHWIFYATDWAAALRLGIFYFIGMLCTLKPIKKIFDLQWTPIAFLAIILVNHETRIAQYLVMVIALPYLVFSLALVPNPKFFRIGTKHELSYGVYLYGFFFQQLVLFLQNKFGQNWGFAWTLIVSLCLTIVTAWLNSVLIEKPIQKLSRKLMVNLKSY